MNNSVAIWVKCSDVWLKVQTTLEYFYLEVGCVCLIALLLVLLKLFRHISTRNVPILFPDNAYMLFRFMESYYPFRSLKKYLSGQSNCSLLSLKSHESRLWTYWIILVAYRILLHPIYSNCLNLAHFKF